MWGLLGYGCAANNPVFDYDSDNFYDDGTSADIRKLIKDGEYIHAKDYESNTALTYAVYNNTPEVVLALVDTIVYVSRNLLLDLSYASLKYPDVIGVLLKAGADVNAENDNGKTALMYAVEEGNTYIVNALLKLGADAKIKDNDGKTALDYAKRSSFTNDTLKRLGASWYQLNWW